MNDIEFSNICKEIYKSLILNWTGFFTDNVKKVIDFKPIIFKKKFLLQGFIFKKL